VAAPTAELTFARKLPGVREIPPFRLVPEPLNAAAAELPPFEWADPEVGTRHRLGGQPDALQGEVIHPRCPHCREPMSFYGQLDSINDDFCIADVGLIHVFLCFDCFESIARVVSY
jgi:hypothetical protein